jgi:hypothetical protein
MVNTVCEESDHDPVTCCRIMKRTGQREGERYNVGRTRNKLNRARNSAKTPMLHFHFVLLNGPRLEIPALQK